jgi:uncharacterized protein DUF4259
MGYVRRIMGTWGAGSFANDVAADWAGDLVDDGRPETVQETLEAAAEAPVGEYLDADEGAEAVAAAEVVAAAVGHPCESDAYSERAIAWAGRHAELADEPFVALALRALDRVEADDSELRDLWFEDGDDSGGEWKAAVDDLRARLLAR